MRLTRREKRFVLLCVRYAIESEEFAETEEELDPAFWPRVERLLEKLEQW